MQACYEYHLTLPYCQGILQCLESGHPGLSADVRCFGFDGSPSPEFRSLSTYRTNHKKRHVMISKRRFAIFGHVARLPASTSAKQALRFQVDSSLDRFPCGAGWKHHPVRLCGLWVDQLHQDSHSQLICTAFLSDATDHADDAQTTTTTSVVIII